MGSFGDVKFFNESQKILKSNVLRGFLHCQFGVDTGIIWCRTVECCRYTYPWSILRVDTRFSMSP